ncbi:MAG: proton-conducting transporter membrane subunit [Bacteroidia bacterium]
MGSFATSRADRWGRFLLLAGGSLALALSFTLPSNLLRVALQVLGAVGLYSALYLPRYTLLYAGFYAVGLVGVALFELSSSPLGAFAGWELTSVAGLGLLVWGKGYSKQALEVGRLIFLTNRLGDVAWLAALAAPRSGWGFLLAGAVKAGLFPFTFWLVQAMRALPPVSALLHSALLVSLGVYWALRYPNWTAGLDEALFLGLGSLSAWGAAFGAVVARHSKVKLAWTTAAHLAIGLALLPASSARSYLFHHSYLKAALFLVLGTAQRQGGFSLGSTAIWVASAGALILSAPPLPPLLLGAECLVAFALGQVPHGLSWAIKAFRQMPLPEGLLLAPPALLGFLSLFENGFDLPPAESLLPLLAFLLALSWPKRLLAFRLDRFSLWAFQRLEWAWEGFSRWAAQSDRQLNQLWRFLYQIIRRGNEGSRWGEDYLTARGWRQLAGRLRRSMAQLAAPEMPLPYARALTWGWAITLLGILLWRLSS